MEQQKKENARRIHYHSGGPAHRRRTDRRISGRHLYRDTILCGCRSDRGGDLSLRAFASMTYYFRDYMLLLSGILNVLIGIMLFVMPVALTVQVITFLLAFLLIFSGAEKLSLASRLRYFRIPHTGSATFSGVLNIILAVVFLLLPFVSALALNYILAAYLVITGIALLIEAAGMKSRI